MNPKLLKITPEEFVTSRWSGGETRQLAIGPTGAVYADRDFLWRVSSATVELEESDFTPLPAYERYISTLYGSMTLCHDGKAPLTLLPGQIHRFDGGSVTHSAGRCTDFNLMLRKGICTGKLRYLELPEQETLPLPESGAPGRVTLLYCVRGETAVQQGAESVLLLPGQACLARCTLSLKTCSPTALMVAEIQEP